MLCAKDGYKFCHNGYVTFCHNGYVSDHALRHHTRPWDIRTSTRGEFHVPRNEGCIVAHSGDLFEDAMCLRGLDLAAARY